MILRLPLVRGDACDTPVDLIRKLPELLTFARLRIAAAPGYIRHRVFSSVCTRLLL